jgi:hypothetical protein
MLYSDITISNAATAAFSRHLWYLNETLVSLSFFDPATTLQDRRTMVMALGKDGSENPSKRVKIEASSIAGKTLADFVTCSSCRFFETLSIPTEFLTVDPSEWESRDDYTTAREFVRSLKVVNDLAERGVALMQTYNNIPTKNEDQQQYLLQLVEEHQRLFPNALKKTVVGRQILD